MKWKLKFVVFIFIVSLISNAFGEDIGTNIWASKTPLPKVSEIKLLKNVKFHVIKKREPNIDGYSWLHGVALAWHKGKLYASFGHNSGLENTASEEANIQVSTDNGETWGALKPLARTKEENLAVSHGVFLSHKGKLWAFLGSFYNKRQKVHTRAYVLDEDTDSWQEKGIILKDGFWPMAEPRRMDNGNWIMAGLKVGGRYGSSDNPAAIAISHGNDFSKWDMVVIPKDKNLDIWGESGVIVDGRNITCISRGGRSGSWAYVSVSHDYGRTWTELKASNLPMTTSKPYCGTLSTGQRYLVCTTAADIARDGRARYPLTIALSPAQEKHFSRIFRIRDDVFADGPGESVKGAALSYPYAIEYQGYLYVGYSNDGGRGSNHNSAELARIPLSSIRPEETTR